MSPKYVPYCSSISNGSSCLQTVKWQRLGYWFRNLEAKWETNLHQAEALLDQRRSKDVKRLNADQEEKHVTGFSQLSSWVSRCRKTSESSISQQLKHCAWYIQSNQCHPHERGLHLPARDVWFCKSFFRLRSMPTF